MLALRIEKVCFVEISLVAHEFTFERRKFSEIDFIDRTLFNN